jgi:hypothetical protein
MPLIPNETQFDVLDTFSDPADFSEGIGSLSVFVQYYKDPASGKMIEIRKTRTIRNHMGTIIRQESEEWNYEQFGAPPKRYEKTVLARPWLPKVNEKRFLREVEIVRDTYYPWANFTYGTNLSKSREISGFVVYDMNPTRTGPTEEGKEKLAEQGLTTEGAPGLVISSGRSWESSLADSSTDQRSGAPQVALWRQPMITEIDEVIESADAWRLYTTRKLHYKGGHVEISGPETQRKEDFSYSLPVPLPAPELRATAGEDGVALTVRGGVASWALEYFNRTLEIHPEGYQFFRRVVSEPARSADPDPWDLYETPPAASSANTVFSTLATTDLGGTPASPSPSATSYAEPGDPAPPEDPQWELIAEVDNLGNRSQGSDSHAVAVDEDVVSTAEYEYFAVATLGDEISEESNHVPVTWGGATTGSDIKLRIRKAKDVTEIELLPPDDPDLLGDEYGELFSFEVPALLGSDFTPQQLGYDIADRVYARAQAGMTQIRIDCTFPLFSLERGQLVKLHPRTWVTIGNALVLNQAVQSGAWFVQGFRGKAKVGSNGKWDVSFDIDAEDNP